MDGAIESMGALLNSGGDEARAAFLVFVREVGVCDDVGELECYAFLSCQPFRSTFWTQYMIWFRYTSLLISVLLIGYGLVRRQVLAVALGAGLAVDGLINGALTRAFAEPPPVATCGRQRYAMPSFQVEHVAFFLVAVAMYPLIWYTPHIRTLYIGLFVAFYVLVAVGQLYFNFNSPAQVVVGSAVGAVLGWLWVMATYVFVYPRVDALLYSSWVQRLYPMVDGLGISYEPVAGDPRPTYRVLGDDEPLDRLESSDDEMLPDQRRTVEAL